MNYVDGFVLPVPKKNLAAYRRMAQIAAKVWREHGALEYVECLADDVKAGTYTSFPQSVKLKPGETVIFAYVVYKSRAHRDKVNAKVMKDPRIVKMMGEKHPFEKDFMKKAFHLLMDIDKMVGGDFEKGLAQLKTVTESSPKP
ncbi:MAG: DUF1428 family protein [Deltaproteobacteria bacterium]|nr:DUF1428 family protein [Deltaproteobacteria bacterium]